MASCGSYAYNSPSPIQLPYAGYGSAVITITPGADTSTCGFAIPVWLNVPNTPSGNIKYVRFDSGPAPNPSQSIAYCYNDPPNGNDNLQCLGSGSNPSNNVPFYSATTQVFSLTSPFTVWLTIYNGTLTVGLGSVPSQQALASVADATYLNGVNSITTNNLGFSAAPAFSSPTCPTSGSFTVDQNANYDEQCFALEGCVGMPCMSCADAGASTNNFCFYNSTQDPNYPEFITMSYTSAQALVNLPQLQSELGGTATTNSNGTCIIPQIWSVGLPDVQCSTAINSNCKPDPYCANYTTDASTCAGMCCNQHNVCPPTICNSKDTSATVQQKCTQSQCTNSTDTAGCMPCSSPLMPRVTSSGIGSTKFMYICALGRVTVTLTNNASKGVIVWYILTENNTSSCATPNTSSNPGYCIPIDNAYPVTGTLTQGQTVDIIVQVNQGLFLSDLVSGTNGCDQAQTQSARARQYQAATGSGPDCDFYVDLCSMYFPFANFSDDAASMEFSGSPLPPEGWDDAASASASSGNRGTAAIEDLSSSNPWHHQHRVFSPTSAITGFSYGFCPNPRLQLTVSSNVLAPTSIDGCSYSQTSTQDSCTKGF